MGASASQLDTAGATSVAAVAAPSQPRWSLTVHPSVYGGPPTARPGSEEARKEASAAQFQLGFQQGRLLTLREAEDHAFLWMEELTNNWKQRVLQAEDSLYGTSYPEDRAVEELATLHDIEQKVEELRSMGLKSRRGFRACDHLRDAVRQCYEQGPERCRDEVTAFSQCVALGAPPILG